MAKNTKSRENGVFEPLDLRNPTRYRHPVCSVRWSSTRSPYWQSFIRIPFLDFAVAWAKNSDIETLTSRISGTGGRTTGRFKPEVVPIDPYKPTEFEVCSCSGSGNNRRRILERSNLQTGSGRGRTDFRSLPEVGLDDLQVCSKSQVAGSNRF
jgi:hypothetical protein